MTPHQILLVKTSCHAALAQRERLAGCFLAELFARDAALWRLFCNKAGMRRPALADGLAQIVGSIDRLHPIAPVLEWLAVQGAAYGVAEPQYAAAGEALTAALASVLGEGFGPEHRQAWAAARREVVGIMAGAFEAVPLAA